MNRSMIRAIAAMAMAVLCAPEGGHAETVSPASYTVAPRPGSPISARFFGMHVHALMPRPDQWQAGEQATAWPTTPVGGLRLWDSDVRWADLEPAPGQWHFARLDHYVQTAQDHGVPVVYVLGSPPAWASARPTEPCAYGRGCAAEPRHLADWERYVRTLARRYRGRIAAYEVWNEPHPSAQPVPQPGFFSGNWDMLMTLARQARAVLQQEDPQARLWTPGFDGSPEVLDDYLRRGGAAWTDAVSFHFYGSSDTHVVPLVQRLRAVMVRHGLGDIPLIDSESSHGAPELNDGHRPDATLSVAYTLRSLVLASWSGVTASYHHAWDNGHSGMVGRRGEIRPLKEAYARLQGWLIGTEPLGCGASRQSTHAPLWVTCKGRQGDRLLHIIWRADAATPAPYVLPAPLSPASIDTALPGPQPAPTARTLPIGAMPVAVWTRS